MFPNNQLPAPKDNVTLPGEIYRFLISNRKKKLEKNDESPASPGDFKSNALSKNDTLEGTFLNDEL